MPEDPKSEEEGEEGEKPWDPADEVDPAAVQKEYMELAKDFLGELKEQKESEKARKRESENARLEAAMSPGPVGMAAYKVPTFTEVSAKCKRCWDEIKKIAPDASPFVQAEIMRSLMHAPDEDDEDDDGGVTVTIPAGE